MEVIHDENAPLLAPQASESERIGRSSTSSPLCDQSNRPSNFPWKPIITILCLAAVQPLGFELIFPFINQMIVENGIVTDPERVGFYSGFIESIFSFMSFLAILPCSYLSDRAGRKPVVLLGTVGLGFSIGLFGISKTYGSMIATRCIGGLLGGTWSAIKVMLAELTDKSQQSMAFSAFSISYRIGQIASQPLGGMLSHPERQYPVFDKPFWHEYPFALPCFIASAFAFFSVLMGMVFLPETSAHIRKLKKHQNMYGSAESSHVEEPSVKKISAMSVMTWPVIQSFTTLALLVLSSETIFALYPLFAFTPVHSGGLGLNERQIGAHMALRSINNIAIMFLYTPLQKRLGTVRLYQMCTLFWPISVAFFPIMNSMARQGSEMTLWLNVVIGTFFTTWSIACLGWTGSNLIVNDAAPSAEALATVNGLSQMATALPMAIAPALSTSLFAYSVENNVLGGHLIWIVLLGIGVLGFIFTLTLREATHDWRQSKKDNQTEEQR